MKHIRTLLMSSIALLFANLPNCTGSYMDCGGSCPATFGGTPATGGMPATGGLLHTGGKSATAGAPANGHQCICALANALEPYSAACTSNTPNDCTLQRAYCGETCAVESTDASSSTDCEVSCIANFASQSFTDLSSYTSGSCTVVILCP